MREFEKTVKEDWKNMTSKALRLYREEGLPKLVSFICWKIVSLERRLARLEK